MIISAMKLTKIISDCILKMTNIMTKGISVIEWRRYHGHNDYDNNAELRKSTESAKIHIDSFTLFLIFITIGISMD